MVAKPDALPPATVADAPPAPLPFVDLRAQYARLKPEIDARIHAVLEHGRFILGPEVAELEGALARFAGSRHAVGVASGTDALLLALMAEEARLLDVLDEQRLTLDARPMAHTAHWVTPVVERRRYDTHFFIAALPEGRGTRCDEREMVESLWVRPAVAAERFGRGELPMVFPTVKTVESLARYRSTDAAIEAASRERVERILPRLVRTDAGVAIVVEE